MLISMRWLWLEQIQIVLRQHESASQNLSVKHIFYVLENSKKIATSTQHGLVQFQQEVFIFIYLFCICWSRKLLEDEIISKYI